MKKAERGAYLAWLATLNAGDEVGVQAVAGHENIRTPWISRVISVHENSDSPWRVGDLSARVADNARWFGKNGRAPKTAYGPAQMLVPVTEKMRRTRAANEARSRLRSIDWYTKSEYVVESVIAAYEKAENEAKERAR